MPTNRQRTPRSRKDREIYLPEALRFYFETGHEDQRAFAEKDRYNEFLFFGDDIADYWRAFGEKIVAEWIKQHPCTRPWFWWNFDSPEPRQRIGGIGTPKHEVLSYAPVFDFGIPSDWISQFECDYYNGRALDIHGVKINVEFKAGDFKGVPIDPDDPPTFEAEAVYLERHGLLTTAERAYLKKHPKLMKLEKVTED